ncbi:MAG: BolA/IbaG family iron-sulfur metabolism protein [Gammaproteobacteria bacterium]|nr:BolA/IbaG family iron-sulfur metabolism protein [Gammaproteobacteria bacterium]
MSIQSEIEQKLAKGLNLQHLEVINESNQHNVPPGSESHFKAIIVSDDFVDKRLLEQHRMVNDILQDELKNHIHALALHTYTQEEWKNKSENAPKSPPCMGGGGNK